MILEKKYINKSLGFELEFDFSTNKEGSKMYFSGKFIKNNSDTSEAIAGNYSIQEPYILYPMHIPGEFLMSIRAEENSPFKFKGTIHEDLRNNVPEKIKKMYVDFKSESNSETFRLLFEAE